MGRYKIETLENNKHYRFAIIDSMTGKTVDVVECAEGAERQVEWFNALHSDAPVL